VLTSIILRLEISKLQTRLTCMSTCQPTRAHFVL
jgi:hypothetical protein